MYKDGSGYCGPSKADFVQNIFSHQIQDYYFEKKNSLKKLFEKLKTRTSNPQKSQRSARRW